MVTKEAQPSPQDSRRAFLDPDAIMRLGSLKLRATRVVEGVLAGLHRSPHKGSSVEFAEYKEYAPGDEIRHIDWKAFAKSDKYYVKQYEEETNLRAYLMIDASSSMNFGDPVTKLEYAQTVVASLAQLLIRQGDMAGLTIFDDDTRMFLPPSGRRSQTEDIITLLEGLEPSRDTATSVVGALNTLAERVTRRSLVVLVSDMLDDPDEVGHLLKVMNSRNMDMLVLHLIDPVELSLPFEGLTLFEGLEGEGNLLVEPDDIREAYQEALEDHVSTLAKHASQARVEYHRVETSRSFEDVLLTVLQGRLRRGGRRR